MYLLALTLFFHWLGSFRIEMTRYLAGAASVALLYWLIGRWIEHRRIQGRRATFADRRREVSLSVQTIAVFGVVDFIAFGMVTAGIIPFNQGPVVVPILLAQLGAMILLHDTYFYWMHRALHLRALFLKAHAAHHRSRTPTSWAAYAFAPLEAVTESLYIPIMLVAVSWVAPLQPWAVFIFLGHQIARNALGHSGFELMPSGFTRHWLFGNFTTAVHHDLHHSEGRHNFGLYFVWWDRLMGTEHPQYHARFEAVATRRRAAAEQAPQPA